jgi:EAL domain-containing protein (putative c-di-GMP-specific phosphodiesterase class I)
MNRQVTRRLIVENEMREGLRQSQFYLAYQPQFDIQTGEMVGAEALLRWDSPRLGMVPPSEFIPIAEANGFIVDLGQFVIHEACRQGRRWLDQGHQIRLAVNVSYVQFLRNGLAQSILDALESAAFPGYLLELELTESVLASNPGRVMDVFRAVANSGVRCAIDDFGTGFSSLSYLRRFSADKLKIDQSFVKDVPGDSEDEIIVSAIITLAHNLRMECIAEGVETQEQLDFLTRLGCDQVQGYLLGKPLSAISLEALLAARHHADGFEAHIGGLSRDLHS